MAHAHEHPAMSPMYTVHGEWHTCKSVSIPRLQYVPPTTSDIYAGAYYHFSSVCHPWRVACMQEHGAQNLGWTIPCSILQRACKTQGPPLLIPINLYIHVFSTYHFLRGVYARASSFISNTCHPQRVSCMQEHITYVARKTRQTQASCLLILTGPQNLRPILGKPRHSFVGLTKPRTNTSLGKDFFSYPFVLQDLSSCFVSM